MAKISTIILMEQPEQQVMSIRTTINMKDLADVAGQIYGKIMAHLAKTGELAAGAPFTCYYNDDLNNLDVEMGFPVARSLQGNDEITARTIPAQRVITGLDLGPYRESDPLFFEMMKWLKDNEYEAQGTIYNYYLNDQNRPESELLTKIVIPVK